MPNLRPAPERATRTDLVYAALRDDLIMARLLPDDVLVEAELAERFEMSKTPVREALQLLVKDRLITVIPRKGYVVRSIGVRDAREIFEVRIALESAIAATAARQAEPSDIAALRELLDAQRASAGTTQLTSAAHRFHERVLDITRNERAKAILRPLFDDTTRIHHLVPPSAQYLDSVDEVGAHEQLLNALIAHDAEAAAQVMREHITSVREITMRALLDG